MVSLSKALKKVRQLVGNRVCNKRNKTPTYIIRNSPNLSKIILRDKAMQLLMNLKSPSLFLNNNTQPINMLPMALGLTLKRFKNQMVFLRHSIALKLIS
jgi:hypothetical protein